jgi:DNA-binding CsgD family transcriptional regulator
VEATKLADFLFDRAQESGRQSLFGAALRCQGLAAETEFEPMLNAAIEVQEALPIPFELGRTLLVLGERRRRAKARAEARPPLRRALSIFESLGAEPWMRRARTELEASGEAVKRASGLSTLTTQERQVARIVATGATNREVAAALFVNPKTVEFHLGNIYRKLGIRSRTELANALLRQTM